MFTFFGRGETSGRMPMHLSHVSLYLLFYSARVQFMIWECFDLGVSMQVISFFEKGGER
jgi:hypothetical protein